MDNRNDEDFNERGDFHENRGCFNPGDDGRRVCNKPGPDPEGRPDNFDQRGPDDDERQFRDDREGRFEGEGPNEFGRPDFERDDNNRGDEEERRRRHHHDE